MIAPAGSICTISLLLSSVFAAEEPAITAAAGLAPRQNDPALVGYISESGGYSDARSCDYPQTLSTSGAYIQCCPTSGSCPFYTSCSGNTLLAAGATVPCDNDAALTCNTAIILPTVGANGGGSYLACWQRTLGASPFTFVQRIGSTTGSGSASATSTGAAASGNTARTSSSATRTSSGSATASAASSASSAAASSVNLGNTLVGDLGIFGGAIAFVAQALL